MTEDDTLNSLKYRRVYDNTSGAWMWLNNNGKYHREDGPAVVEEDGSKSWWINGQLHREDGPAVEYSGGTKLWFLNGKKHRIDGPAVIYSDGRTEWWFAGRPSGNP